MSSNSAAPQSVVFIDSNVPDLQALLDGLSPGAAAFVIDPSSDGLAQIAAILADSDLTGLSSISIVGHGSAGDIQIGSTTLDAGDLSSDGAALSQIGEALAPGGAFQLYACDTAAGTVGQQFIADLSQLMGGIEVAASTQDIGTLASANGGFENWTLDDSTGAAAVSAPFTDAALADYQGLLSGTTVTASAVATTLKTDADHDGGISPGDTVTSSVTITDTTSTAATNVALSASLTGLTAVTNSVLITPIAVNDSYTATGNTPLTVSAASGVLANDTEFNGGTLTAINASSVVGGAVTLNSNGSFTFTPTTGFSGAASFQYTADDAGGNSDQKATVTITVGPPTWYVNSSAAAGGDGTAAHPFQTIQAAINAAAGDTDHGVGDTINVAAGSYSGAGITLASGEKLIGSGSTTFTVSSGTAITLGTNNTISGIKIVESGSGAGIADVSGGIGTLTMSDIAVTTGSGTGISLTHGGTVDITGTGNTLNSASGTALDIENTNIGSSGVTFKSISDGTGTGSTGDGIVLINTGSSGGLTVTGDGSTAGSGGTIENKTGGSVTSGTGIYLNNTADVSLAYMQLNGLAYDGIYGQTVNNFSMDHTVVNGANGSAVGEGSVILGSGEYAGQSNANGITGTASITNSTISGGWYDNLDVFDQSGTADVTLNNDTFGDNNATHGNQNVYIDPNGASVINATVTNSKWTGVAGGSNFYFDVNSTSGTGSNLSFTGNTVGDNLGGTAGENGSGTVEAIAIGETGTTTNFDIENNAFSGANGTAVAFANNETGNGSLGGTVNLTFNNNTIGAATGQTTVGADDSGSAAGVGLEVEPNGGTFNASITNNHIYEFGDNGIDITADVGISSGVENGTLNAEITGNTVGDPDSYGLGHGALQDDIYLDGGGANPGANDNFVYNATVGGTTAAEKNTTLLFTSGEVTNGSTDIVLIQDGAPAINLTSENGSTTSFNQYTGPADDGGNQVESFLSTYNTTPNGNFALPSGDVAPDFAGGKPSAEAPATGPTFGTPSVSGADTEGDQLTAALVGSSATYQWQEAFSGTEFVDIFGATSKTYTLQESDVGATVRVIETSTYSDGLIDTVASSATSAAIADHLTLTDPAISGNDTVGQILTASTPLTDNSDATITYQWEENFGSGFNPISGATGQTYRLASTDAGADIEVIATATDPHGGNVSETSAITGPVNAFTDPSLSSISIGTLPGDDAVTVSWQATVDPQSDQLIVNPSETGTVSGSDFTTVNTSGTVTLDPLTLGGEIFADTNDNGLLDNGESGISGVSVSVFVQGSNTALEMTTTNSSGDYAFTNLAAGNYDIQIGLPSAYTNSSPVRDTTPNDYDGNRNYGLALSAGVIDTNPIAIAYDSPHPANEPVDTTDTLDIGLVKGVSLTVGNPSVTFDGGGAPVTLDGNAISIVDPSGTTLIGATVSITGGGQTGDVLSFNSSTNTETFSDNDTITASYSNTNGSGVLTLSGTASINDYQDALEQVQFGFNSTINGGTDVDPTAGGTDLSRTISWAVSDASGTSTAQTTSLTVVHTAPTVTAGAAATYEIGASAAVLADSGATVSDPDSGGDLTGATVTIGSGFVSGADELTIDGLTNGAIIEANGTISFAFSGNALTLTTTGTTTLADYRAALELVAFSTTSTTPGSRTIQWSAADGSATNGTSTTATSTVNVATGPQITADGSATFDGGASPVTLDSGLSISDVGSTTLSGARVTIAGAISGDTLVLDGATSGTGTIDNGANGSITYTLSGSALTLRGVDTLADYQAVLDLVAYAFSPGNGDPTAGRIGGNSLTIDWSVNDGTASSNTATSNLTVVHTAPTVTAGATVDFETGSTAPATLDAGVTVSDPDSGGNLIGATVAIQGAAAGDALTINGSGSGTFDAGKISYSFSGSSLVLSGSDSISAYQAALDAVTFSTTALGAGVRTIDWTVNDGSAADNTNIPAATSTVQIVTGPAVTAGATVTYTQGGAAVALDTGLAVSDQAGSPFTGATVKIDPSTFVSGDTLNFINQSNITGTYNAATGVLTLSGTDTVTDYQAALESITFTTSATTTTPRTIDWSISDAVDASNTATSNVDVARAAPEVTAGATAAFEAGTSPVVLDTAITISDGASTTLSSATVTIANFQSGDVLNIPAGDLSGNISATYDSGSGLLSLVGIDTLANYQTALDAVTFTTTSANPAARTIDWSVSDGVQTSTQATSTVDITTGPLLTIDPSATYNAGGAAVALSPTVTVTDTDTGVIWTTEAADSNANGFVQNASADVSGGKLYLIDGANPSSGVANEIQVYDPTTNSWVAESATDKVARADAASTVDAVGNIYVIDGSDGTNALTEVTVFDPSTGTVTQVASNGTARLNAAAAVGSNGDIYLFGGYSVSGQTTTDYNTVEVYDPTAGPTGSWTTLAPTMPAALSGATAVADGNDIYVFGGQLDTGFLSDAVYEFNTSTNSWDPTPVATLPTAVSYAAGGLVGSNIVIAAGVAFSTNPDETDATQIFNPGTDQFSAGPTLSTTGPVDFGIDQGMAADGSQLFVAAGGTLQRYGEGTLQMLNGATVSIGGFLAGDTLGFTNQSGITGTYNSNTGVLTLTGSASLADYATALESITYSSTAGDPTNGGTDPTRTLSWVGNDGVGTTTPAALSTLDVLAGPFVTLSQSSVTYDAAGTAATLDSGVTVTDGRSATLASAAVSISSNFQTGDVLGFSAADLNAAKVVINGATTTNITESYDSATGVLTLTGTDTLENYDAALGEVAFSSSLTAPSTAPRTVTFTANDGISSGNATETVDVRDQPTVTAGTTTTFDGGGAAVALDPQLTVGDPSSTTLDSATVTITNALGGDTLNFINTALITSSTSSSAGTLTLTLNGTDTVAGYQAALDSITYSFAPTNGDPTTGARTIDWSVNDGTLGSATATSTLDTVHVAPTLTVTGTTQAFDGGSVTPVTLATSVTLNDPDSGDKLASATVTIGSGFDAAGDTLSFTNTDATTEGDIVGNYDSATGQLVLTSGGGAATVAQWAAALAAVQYSFVSASEADPAENGSDLSRTFTWTVNDDSATNNTATATSTFRVVHEAPVVSVGSGATAAYGVGGSAVPLDGTLTVTDADSGGDLTGATVTIGNGFVSGDTLNYSPIDNITIVSNSVGMLVLTGTASVTDYDAALESITFSTTNSTLGDRTIGWTVTDGSPSNGIGTATSTVAVVQGLTVAATGTVTFDGGGLPVTLDNSVVVFDPVNPPNSTDLVSATVAIANAIGGDTLNFTPAIGADIGDITATSEDSGQQLLFTSSGSATVAEWDTALQSITYSFNPSDGDPSGGGLHPSRTIDWSITDNTTVSTTATSIVDTVHTPPAVTVGTPSVAFTGGSTTPVTLDGGIMVGDVDSSGMLESATVTIGSTFFTGDTLGFAINSTLTGITGPAAGNYTLSFADNSTLSAFYNSATGELTLTGTDAIGDYQAALEAVTYSFTPSSNDPTKNGSDTSRTITWQVSDGLASSAAVNSTTTLDVIHAPPVVTPSGAAATFEGGGGPVQLDTGITVTDPDSSGTLASAAVTIANAITGDTLSFTNNGTTMGNIAVSSNSNGTLVLDSTGDTATFAQWNAALQSITYSFNPPNHDPTNGGTDASRTIDWVVTDGSASNGTSTTATSTLDVMHEPPVVTVGAPNVTFTGGSATPVTLDSGISVSDTDSGGNLTGATVTIAAADLLPGDQLMFSASDLDGATVKVGGSDTGITESYDSTTGALTLSGTDSIANYKAALAEVEFVYTGDGDPTNGGTDTARTITWQVNDGASLSSTTNASTTLTVTHTAPTLTVGTPSPTFIGGGPAVTLDSAGIAIADPDSGGNLFSATVTISGGGLSSDVLSFNNGSNTETFADGDIINASYSGEANGVLTLTGFASIADYVMALSQVQFGSTGNADPTDRGADVSRGFTWQVNDAALPNAASLSSTANTTTTLSVVHTAPAVAAGGVATFSGGGPAALDTGVALSDVDSAGTLAGATVTISTGFTAGDTLEIIGQTSGTITDGGGTISYAFSGRTLTLSGTDTLADYQAALKSVAYTFSPSGGDATAGGTDTSRAISWQVTDGSTNNGLSNTATSALSVPTTPVVTAGATVNDSASQIFAPAQLFSASDAESAPILSYQIEDETRGTNQGFWVLNGAVLPNGQLTTLTVAQLSQLSFVAGSASTPVSDTLEVAASDASGFGPFTTVMVMASAHASTSPPTVTAANELEAPSLTLAASSLFSATASGGNTIAAYEVVDTTTDSGHWVFNGTVEPSNQHIVVTTAQLSELSFDTGYGSDTLMVRANDGSQWGSFVGFSVTPPPNAPPPAGTEDTLVMLRNGDGAIEFYDIGQNSILLDGPLGQITPALQVAGVGGFNGSDTADLLMRDPTTGAFTLYDVSNNNITGNVPMGQVGPEWTVSGFGDFSTRLGETDMLMRNSNNGDFEVYDISNNTITFAGPMGQVGLEWTVSGFGDFSSRPGETDMLMRNSNNGDFEVYDIANNAITFSGPMGQVGLEWTIAGFGDFSTRANETDMLLRNSNNGDFELYDISNNAITFSGPMGQVGLEWTIAGFGDFSGNPNETDMLMRNTNNGDFVSLRRVPPSGDRLRVRSFAH